MTRRPMLLLNCQRCDDVMALTDKVRICECGQTRGKLGDGGSVEALGAVRVLTIDWEAYDGLAEGAQGVIGVLPFAQYRAKGSE